MASSRGGLMSGLRGDNRLALAVIIRNGGWRGLSSNMRPKRAGAALPFQLKHSRSGVGDIENARRASSCTGRGLRASAARPCISEIMRVGDGVASATPLAAVQNKRRRATRWRRFRAGWRFWLVTSKVRYS